MLNIFSQIGIIMFIGLVAKNGIFIVEFVNQWKEVGLSCLEVIKEVVEVCFWFIFMMSLFIILGVLLIVLVLGVGFESWVFMGIVVIGGLVFLMVLIFYVILAIYFYFFSKEVKCIKWEE